MLPRSQEKTSLEWRQNMIVVSGCPRSGTSLMMSCLLEVFGENLILGSKWPFSERMEARQKQGANEDDKHYAIRMYLERKADPNRDKEMEKTKDMNPNGFWECQFTVEGVFYRFGMADLLEELEREAIDTSDTDKHICKIVSQGLARSDPRYISKIIFMMRPPRAVAKSQERLKRVFFKDAQGTPIDLSDYFKIQTPEMFIKVTTQVSAWLLRHSYIPFLLVNFDDLVNDPAKQFVRIQEFIGTGDFSPAISRIEPRLRRSNPEDVEHDLWEESEVIYEKFCAGDYAGVVQYMNDPSRKIYRENASWLCPRWGRHVTFRQCEVCKSKPTVRENFKKQAEDNGIEWHKEPCPYECGFGSEKSISIEESIKNNFWIEDKETNCGNSSSDSAKNCG